MKKELLLRHLSCPSTSVFCLLASHLREANETLKKPASTLWTLQVQFLIQVQMPLDRTGQGRQMWILRGDSPRAWEDSPPWGCLPPRCWSLADRGRTVHTSQKVFRTVHSLKTEGEAGRIKGTLCYLADRTIAWHSWFHASARSPVQGAGSPFLLTSSPHTFQMCFSVPISYSEAPAESINCHNQCRLFSVPQDTKQTKQNHWKLKDAELEGALAGAVNALRITTAVPPVAVAAKWGLTCFFL